VEAPPPNNKTPKPTLEGSGGNKQTPGDIFQIYCLYIVKVTSFILLDFIEHNRN
jgi:hypothetical protein